MGLLERLLLRFMYPYHHYSHFYWIPNLIGSLVLIPIFIGGRERRMQHADDTWYWHSVTGRQHSLGVFYF